MSVVPYIQISPPCLSFFAPQPRDGFSKCHFNDFEKTYFDTYVYVLYMNESLVPKAFRSLTKDIILYNNYFISFKFVIT